MTPLATRSLALGLLLASPALAQNQFGPLGNQIMDGSQNLVTVNLGFNFTMPGGAVVSSVDVDEHGRIVEVGSDASDSSETTGEMTGNPTGSINVLWDFNGYTAANAGVYFFTDNASFATITWTQVTFVGAPCNYQCQLFGDGRIVMVYDSNCPADDGIIGVCPGNGATLPTQSNLDDAIVNGTLISADPTVFEDFGFTAGVDAFDFPSSALEFIPTSAGGATGWTVVGNAGVVDPLLPFAQNEEAGGGDCQPAEFTPVTLFFTPDGNGGYDATSAPIAFDTNIGPDAGLTGDDEALGGFDLGFVFPWPDGSSDQFAKIDSNGRIGPDVSNFNADFSPSLADMHGDNHAIVAALWTDINISAAGSGKIHFNTVPGASATFTWDNVYQFSGSQPITFQVTLFAGGLIQINLLDHVNYNQVGGSNDDTIIGTSTGAGPDPGESDLSALGTANTGATTYEYWDSSGTAPVEPFDLINDLTANYGELAALSVPRLGTSWDLEIQNVPAQTTLGLYVVGTTTQNLDVTPLGSPCTLVPAADLIVVALPSATPGVLTPLNFAIPNQPNLVGFELFVQGVHDGAPTPPFAGFAGLPWAFVFTNAFKGTVGSI
jgi:hypothetical protein